MRSIIARFTTWEESRSELALSYDRILVVSTLDAIEEQAAGKKLQNASSPGQIEIGDDQFFADTLELNKGPGPSRA